MCTSCVCAYATAAKKIAGDAPFLRSALQHREQHAAVSLLVAVIFRCDCSVSPCHHMTHTKTFANTISAASTEPFGIKLATKTACTGLFTADDGKIHVHSFCMSEAFTCVLFEYAGVCSTLLLL